MKKIQKMNLAELAAYVQTQLRAEGIELVLSGGATVSLYSGNKYVSKDVDLVNQYLRQLGGRNWFKSGMNHA